ncbi:recombination protein RecR [Rickettsiales endosymbiont of Peranema trichophorum]|uniref:recombination mediator RecR n=1 Tax=Rickettsiales endosymbiont of Peranema trichophorum TaxID=2486577 RepID=UPI001022F50F|nr:recombination mediator RecR [Rickettsiales endosymbiont of Peranema trichophorum]RZI47163.1 recombination protein RecR [Rickettsiales endosymbiont of Peranema trichophorum]
MKTDVLEELISMISKLPGLGPRSARRIVLHLVKKPQLLMLPLAAQLESVANSIKTCEICNNVDVASPCAICTSTSRDGSVVCVVETISDLWALERGKLFNGKYHILGGTLSAIAGRSPETLSIEQLKARVGEGTVSEVIVATNATLEGQTTGYYIVEMLSEFQVKITRLASGIPIGAELDYIDDGTINLALKMRQKFS